MVNIINDLIDALEILASSDTEKNRENLGLLGARLFNEEFVAYKEAGAEMQSILDGLFVSQSSEDPKYLRMDMEEIKLVLNKMKGAK